MKAGYATVRPLPAVTDEQFEAMVAGRNLLLVNDVIEQPNADTQAMTPAYVAASVRRLRHWLDTGRYRNYKVVECLDVTYSDHALLETVEVCLGLNELWRQVKFVVRPWREPSNQ